MVVFLGGCYISTSFALPSFAPTVTLELSFSQVLVFLLSRNVTEEWFPHTRSIPRQKRVSSGPELSVWNMNLNSFRSLNKHFFYATFIYHYYHFLLVVKS